MLDFIGQRQTAQEGFRPIFRSRVFNLPIQHSLHHTPIQTTIFDFRLLIMLHIREARFPTFTFRTCSSRLPRNASKVTLFGAYNDGKLCFSTTTTTISTTTIPTTSTTARSLMLVDVSPLVFRAFHESKEKTTQDVLRICAKWLKYTIDRRKPTW